MSIVESYRAAAAKLEQACVQPAGYGRGSLVGAAAALVSGQIARVLLTMEIEPWLLQAARLRLLLEALLAEQDGQREDDPAWNPSEYSRRLGALAREVLKGERDD